MTDFRPNIEVLLIGRKMETRKIMLLACDNGYSIFQMKILEVVLRMRGETVMNEYQIL